MRALGQEGRPSCSSSSVGPHERLDEPSTSGRRPPAAPRDHGRRRLGAGARRSPPPGWAGQRVGRSVRLVPPDPAVVGRAVRRLQPLRRRSPAGEPFHGRRPPRHLPRVSDRKRRSLGLLPDPPAAARSCSSPSFAFGLAASISMVILRWMPRCAARRVMGPERVLFVGGELYHGGACLEDRTLEKESSSSRLAS